VANDYVSLLLGFFTGLIAIAAGIMLMVRRKILLIPPRGSQSGGKPPSMPGPANEVSSTPGD
jgi:hypothetical protein